MKTGAAGLVCRRCGISRATLRKWWRRYQADGEAGLVEHSRRPHRLAARGREFLAEAVQQRLMDWAIKFRPIPLRSPHLNGKVERTHRADREEFWDTVDPKDPEIEAKLSEWQHHWNWHRPHTALGSASSCTTAGVYAGVGCACANGSHGRAADAADATPTSARRLMSGRLFPDQMPQQPSDFRHGERQSPAARVTGASPPDGVLAHDSQIRMRQHGQRDVPVPARPRADLVLDRGRSHLWPPRSSSRSSSAGLPPAPTSASGVSAGAQVR